MSFTAIPESSALPDPLSDSFGPPHPASIKPATTKNRPFFQFIAYHSARFGQGLVAWGRVVGLLGCFELDWSAGRWTSVETQPVLNNPTTQQPKNHPPLHNQAMQK